MDSCRAAGWLFLHGFGVAEDAARAEALYKKACLGKNTAACMELAVEYHHWHNWPAGPSAAVAEARQHELVCARGEQRGCLALALDVLRRPEELSAFRDTVGKTAQKTAEDACTASNVVACLALLEIAQQDDDTPGVEVMSAKLLEMCLAGEVRACEPVVNHHWKNKTPEEQRSLSKEVYLKSCRFSQAECRAGRAEECSFAVACVGQYGDEPRGRETTRAELTYHACVGGRDFEQCAALATRLESADGVPRDLNKARLFDLAACQHGVFDGCWRSIARLRKEGQGPDVDKKIFELTKMACRMNDKRDSGGLTGCMALADLYENGRGTQKDVEKAVEIWTAGCRYMVAACNELRRLNRPVPPDSADADEP
ncbi:tetratricopeptide repeat protein [Sorangium cellulosum]|uniref:Uncharacterized protein n=1 Tax=Sorangium cellulosum TaxID=56 RepID=A0A150QN58_SORCE|nr:sel1 repeat family protein [Sorangium cellulosum]KYF69423.1 hypothetical protein BE15_39685 [Sorangium cellulosum]